MIVHTCACGLKYDAEAWARLPAGGYMVAENPDELLELRECECGSHRAITIPGPGFWLQALAGRAQNARKDARRECFACAVTELERAKTCLRQAEEQLAILLVQRNRARAAEHVEAAE